MMKKQTSLVLITTEDQELNYKQRAERLETIMPGVKVTVVDDIQSFIGLISDQTFHLDIAIIDIKKISELVKTNVYDVIYTLNTLGLCSTEKTTSGFTKTRDFSVAVGVTLRDDEKLIQEVINADIKGIFPLGEDYPDEERRKFISEVRSGKHYIPESVKDLLSQHKKLQKKSCPDLTPRQQQVLNLVKTRGISNKIIARQLKISESTVKLHMSAIFKKYGVKNRTQLALFCKSSVD